MKINSIFFLIFLIGMTQTLNLTFGMCNISIGALGKIIKPTFLL